MKQIVFCSERLYFRTAKSAMASEMLDFARRNDDFFRRWEPARPKDYYTLKYQRELVRYESRQLKSMRGLDLWLFDREKNDGRVIGKLSAFGIIPGNYSCCVISYKIDQAYARRGYMREAILRLEEILRDYFGIHRIEAYILPENTASLALVRSAGFTREGLSEKAVMIGREWRDHYRCVKLIEPKEEQA